MSQAGMMGTAGLQQPGMYAGLMQGGGAGLNQLGGFMNSLAGGNLLGAGGANANLGGFNLGAGAGTGAGAGFMPPQPPPLSSAQTPPLSSALGGGAGGAAAGAGGRLSEAVLRRLPPVQTLRMHMHQYYASRGITGLTSPVIGGVEVDLAGVRPHSALRACVHT
eukprot:115990-Chlamydomonas_euryale.AAC.1